MRATPASLLIALVLATPIAQAQTAPTSDAREALRASLVAQARAARAREDYAACATFLESAGAIRADNLIRYAASQCAFAAGRLPEAERIAADCLGQPEGPVDYRAECTALAAQVRALATAPSAPERALSRHSPPSVPPSPAERRPVASVAPIAPPARDVAMPNASRIPAGAVALWAVGGVLLGTAAVAAVLHTEALDGCAVEGSQAVCATPLDLDRARSAGTWEAVGTGAFWGGLAAVAGGTTWWLLGRRVASVTIAVTPTGAGIAGRF